MNSAAGVDQCDRDDVLAGEFVYAKVDALAILQGVTAVADGVATLAAAARRDAIGVFVYPGNQLPLGEVEVPTALGLGGDVPGQTLLYTFCYGGCHRASLRVGGRVVVHPARFTVTSCPLLRYESRKRPYEG